MQLGSNVPNYRHVTHHGTLPYLLTLLAIGTTSQFNRQLLLPEMRIPKVSRYPGFPQKRYSPSVGALMEPGRSSLFGPCSTIRDPHSLIVRASVFFIDHSVGFEFSAATYQGDTPPIYTFADFTSFRGRPVHVGGASRAIRAPIYGPSRNGND
ncbi:hypothetical protein BDQ17DRAFT_1335159 [Cyathus striatus]|nr:hypothetical protein BDQ17DRAFT_1335159 [Cyathus striatus]